MTLEDLAALCAGSVVLEINPHRGLYMSVDEYLDDHDCRVCERSAKFERREPLIELQFYPSSPTGFVVLYGNAVEDVLALAEVWWTKS